MKTRVIILAAGKGTRMKSELPKSLHQAAGRSMAQWAVAAANAVDDRPVMVVGYGHEQVKAHLGDEVDYAIQSEQKGTGHAVMMAEEFFPDEGYVIITLGDMMLLPGTSVKGLLDETVKNDWAGAVLTAVLEDPTGYGRVVRDADGNVVGIVEHRDCNEEQLKIKEMNTSVFCFKAKLLKEGLKEIGCDNAQGEYYLTDMVSILNKKGHKMGVVHCSPDEAMGVNDRAQLAEAGAILRDRINGELMRSGVTIIDPKNTYIDYDVQIGRNTVIYPGNVIEKGTIIGEGCTLYSGCHIECCKIADGAVVRSSTMLDAVVGENTTVGPNAYLRPKTVVGKNCRIGDFVEIKDSNIGDGTKISHLAYVGDADLGRDVNIGCGVVFSNYDGLKKHRTVIEDHAFIGCNTNLVPPVKVGEYAYTAAGSTITENVPADALAIARARQVIKEGRSKLRKGTTEDN